MAKLHFRDYKARVRADLIRTHYGPETLEEAVQNYINRNVDLYDPFPMVQVRYDTTIFEFYHIIH